MSRMDSTHLLITQSPKYNEIRNDEMGVYVYTDEPIKPK